MTEKYIEEARKILSKFKKIDYAFMFGSALKTPLRESDVDILIGGNLDAPEKNDLTAELALVLKRKIDIVMANESPPELVLKAFSHGQPLLVNKQENLKRDYFRNYYSYDDARTLRELKISRVKRRYSYGG
ncbi:MAG: nucleotidyltransferase domain-containing protein [Candidatus Ratteibacteria bacterium]|nr:nucleotidyltransferase domain-containing protein [Candidatus Ratteibacteria bacterium]